MTRGIREISIERYLIGALGLLAMFGIVCLITLSPDPVDKGAHGLVNEILAFLHSRGVPDWFGYNKLEFCANILMFVPFGFFASLLFPFRKVWIAGLVGTAFSGVLEGAQALLLPDRYASMLDVLANTIGGWIGVGLALLVRLVLASRDRRRSRDVWRDRHSDRPVEFVA